MNDEQQPLTVIEVMRNPVVSYRVFANLAGEEVWEGYDDEATAVSAAGLLESGGAAEIVVERVIMRVVEDIERVEWRDDHA